MDLASRRHRQEIREQKEKSEYLFLLPVLLLFGTDYAFLQLYLVLHGPSTMSPALIRSNNTISSHYQPFRLGGVAFPLLMVTDASTAVGTLNSAHTSKNGPFKIPT